MELIIFIGKILIYYWQTGRLDMMVVYEVPLLTFFFLVSLWIFCRNRQKHGGKLFVILYGMITLLMFLDAAYSSYFGKYISVNQIYQLGSLAEIAGDGNVIGAAVNPACLLTLIDYPLAVFYFFYLRKKKTGSEERLWQLLRKNGEENGEENEEKQKGKKGIRLFLGKQEKWIRHLSHLVIYLAALALFLYYGWNFYNERYVQKVNHIEFFTYHTNDLLVNVGGRIRRSKVDETEIRQHVSEIVPKTLSEEDWQYTGLAKGKNLILIQVESFQDFVIGADYEGQELTPNLNKLIHNDSFYFDRFYSTTGVGNTCDAEFTTLNSLYANEERECYRMFVDNTFDGLPWMLRREGYDTMAFHGYVKTFWNRDEAYKNQGIEHYYSQEELDLTEVSGFGLTDKEMFRQAVDILKTKKEPFFSFMITLTNHIPYDMPQELATLELAPEDRNTMFGRYLQTIRYTDEAIGELMDHLKEAGLYDNTMIVLYGDHQGMNKETLEVQLQMTKFLGKQYRFDEMLKIPLIIHIPGMGESKTITSVGGQIDTMPTIANLMGIKSSSPYIFGHDLLNAREEFIAQISYIGKGSFLEGSNKMIYAIGRDGSIENGQVYHIPDGEHMNLNQTLCEEYSRRAVDLLDTCKEVLKNNLIANYVTH